MKNENINTRISFDGNNLLISNNESVRKIMGNENNSIQLEQNQMLNDDGYYGIINKTEELLSKHSNVEILKRKYKYFTPRTAHSLNKPRINKYVDSSKTPKNNETNKSKSKNKNISLRDKIKIGRIQ